MNSIARIVARIRSGFRRSPLHRFNVRTEKDAAIVLAELIGVICNKDGEVLLVGPHSRYRELVCDGLGKSGVSWKECALNRIDQLGKADVRGVACVALVTLDSKSQLDAARALIRNPATIDIPLEYIALPQQENAPMQEWDRHCNEDFVSAHLATRGDARFRIYAEALQHFKQKTEVRDYLDLSQLVESVVVRSVPGNLAEFGSYKGHSGYLTSRVLESLGSDKTLYMFDMFENFPEEDVGVDRFWSSHALRNTHRVDFTEVQRKFEKRANVRLVKGDFTKTISETDTGPLALAFIDCDSYRATKFLLEYLWPSRIPAGGIVAMEDYGHAALLGNRLAVHEFFDGRKDAYVNFSQFSGFFVAVKLAA